MKFKLEGLEVFFPYEARLNRSESTLCGRLKH